MTQPFLAGLNPEQLEAATLPHQSALILAGAGSGKTRVLTTRIAHLIQTGQASPAGILAVTFTNKAAKEMLTRLGAMLPINTRGMWIGTFHGLCNRLLRAHHREAGLPALFQILDSADQLGAIKRLLKALNVDDEKYPPKQLQHFINNTKDQGLRAKDVEAHDPYTRKQQELFAAYDEQCQREGVVDFAELLLRSYELLSRDASLRAHYQSRFRHILVDEFQDTNRLQYLWLKQLAGPDAAVFAVGDDDQSIYAFRGARVGNMQDFERDFGVDKVIKLEQNYRSHGNILDAANALIAHNRGRLGKNLWTAESTGEPIRLYEAANDQEEAQFIVDEAKALKREGIEFAHIALLYRSNAQSRVLEHALFNAGIPYRVHGGLRFFERQEIKHALAYLRLIGNTDDDGALLRVINFPARGIGARSLEQLQEIARQNQSSLWQAAKSGQLGGKAGTSIGSFLELIRAMQDTCEGLPLPEQIEHMLAQSGLLAHYQAEKDGADRVDNLNELVNAAVGFVNEIEDDSLVAFLTHAALEAGEHQAGEGSDALQLMTVHAAKGLEFHAVFLSGLEEGLFPHDNARNEADGVEEERRLMYVAITRARRRLYLSLAQSRMLHGQFRYGLASRFLNEIPENLLKRINPAPKAYYAPEKTTWAPQPTPAGSPAAYSRDSSSPWHVGQNVAHAKFGSGVIVNCEGSGADARVQVKFRNAGVKWLALEYAKLTPA
ncbi:UvrD/REP helicase [Sulfuricella denitrificans skB26]|uniref:DNA 3'-5' helicase n=1 Tax=Sulfuricella denitrificans (strain DSM 22764 / NBRC 105220 / skB26) TaxID=1163617 RepID=S6AAN2_SULDS|nr:UvrD-helicase domain-containing protein [Sulfuricella denitrificans]BAN33898.1 UvrD/REP helicase [Sulfuricella denitrificans skB26]